MITTGSSSLELKFDVSINGAQMDRSSIQTVSLELAENMHNIAVMEVAGIPPQYLLDYLNLPLSIYVSAGASDYLFNGYIYSMEPVSRTKDGLVNKSPFQQTRVVCFGATYVMRGKRSRSWENYTLPQMASEIADKYGFTVSVPNDPYVFTRYVQSEMSDWSALVDAANYLGYRVWATETNIDIWDPFTALSRYGSRSMYALSGNNGSLKSRPGQVIKFTAHAGSATKTTDTLHALVDSDVVTMSLNESTGYGETIQSLYEDEVAENAVTVDMVEVVLKGRNRKKLPITAHAEVVGDPSIRPGTVVDLQRYESGLDGLWIVKAVRHDMFRGSCMSYVDMVRDAVGNDTFTQTVQSFPPPLPPSSVLVNNRWRAQTEQVYIYG